MCQNKGWIQKHMSHTSKWTWKIQNTFMLTHCSDVVVSLSEVETANFGVFRIGFAAFQDNVPFVRHRYVAREPVEFYVLRLAGERRALRNCAIITHLCKSRALLCFTTSDTVNLLARDTSKLTGASGVLHKNLWWLLLFVAILITLVKKMESSHNSLELFDMYHLFFPFPLSEKMATILP